MKTPLKFISTTFIMISFLAFTAKSQSVEPPFWWAGMPVETLQLMINQPNIRGGEVSFTYPGVTLAKTVFGDSPNYLFAYLNISPDAKPGFINITLTQGKKKTELKYELKARNLDPKKNQGFNSSDVIYLLMPDRFANGNPENDAITGMLETTDRTKPNGRHGGDIKGIANNLSYIKDVGMTAVWLTPVFENDMTPSYGAYHGYAATDLYKIDRRFGTNQEFVDFVDECHTKGLKVIMDMIHNHIGDQHPWMKDLPTKDWVHDYQKYGQTNYRGVIQSDPYASQYDLDKLQKGWFVEAMPDLNQRNEQLSDYLIQNTLWWIEYSGVDGIRMDTYVYPYKDYMARWAKEVLAAYPTFNIVGEAWIETVPHTAYWQQSKINNADGYNSFLPTVTDFQFIGAISGAMNTDFNWTDGLRKLYYYLSQDRLYSDPKQNVIFLDNHDTERFYTSIGENKEKFKMAYAYLMTVRGIPQVYYGTELMFANAPTENDSRKRPDMPGGWTGDTRNVFTESGRSESEKEIYDYVKRITNWRKTSSAIHWGETTHFLPEENTYVFFRYTDTERVLIVINMNQEAKKIAYEKYIELLRGFTIAKDIVSGESQNVSGDIVVKGMQTTIFELIK